MQDYLGIKCPVCDIPFQKDDDIVVCPHCGAPYHRHCYQEKGHCVFEAEHGTGKAWEAPQPPQPPDLHAEIKDQECPVCGVLNAHSALFCNRCGSSLSGQPDAFRNRPQQNPSQQNPYGDMGNTPQPPQGPTPFGSFGTPVFFDPMGGVSPTEQLDDNVSFGDVSKLVKQNTAYYMPVFRYMKSNRKNKFSFTAFLFTGPWMLYRKQYKFGAFITALMFLLYGTAVLSYQLLSIPIYYEAAKTAGIDLAGLTSLTASQNNQIAQVLMANPGDMLRFILPFFCWGGMLIVMIVMGFIGNKLYMKHCIRTISRIKQTEAGGEIGQAIEAKSGVNLAIAVSLFVCYMILTNLPLLFG